MKRQLIKTGIIVGIALSLFLLFRVMQYKEEMDYRERGSPLIEKVEDFRRKNKRLPDNAKELGLKDLMNDGPYYVKENSENYKVSFVLGVDDYYTYHSDNKEWRDE